MNSFSRFGWLSTIIPATLATGVPLMEAVPARMLTTSACDASVYITSGVCYPEYNNEGCEYSFGSCCWCTCTESSFSDYCVEEGSLDDVHCIDPGAECSPYFVPEAADTPAPVTPTPEPVRNTPAPVTPTPGPVSPPTTICSTSNYNTGICTEGNNNADCEYDQGDCCWCDCTHEDCPPMGDANYDCRNPLSACSGNDDDDDEPTPAPVTTTLATSAPSSAPATPVTSRTPQPTVGDRTSAPATPVTSTTPQPAVGDRTSAPTIPVSSMTPQPTTGDRVVTPPPETTSTTSLCNELRVGDGYCDNENNNETCLWDGGDCCECTCDTDTTYPCGVPAYECLDPRGTCESVGETTAASSSPSSLYKANIVFALGIGCAVKLVSIVATS